MLESRSPVRSGILSAGLDGAWTGQIDDGTDKSVERGDLDGEKPLSVPRGLEPLHVPLPLTDRLGGIVNLMDHSLT